MHTLESLKESENYIRELKESVGLSTETYKEVIKAINKERGKLKNLNLSEINSNHLWLKESKYGWIQGSVGFPVKVEILSVNMENKSVDIKTRYQCGKVGFDKLYKTEMSCPCR